MNDIDFYNENINKLFEIPFFNLKKNIFNWNKVKTLFDSLYKNLKNSDNNNDFLSNYYLFNFLFIYYTNYLKYLGDNQNENLEIYKYIDLIKYDRSINKFLIKNRNDIDIKIIFNLSNQLINYKLKKKKINDNNIDIIINNYINNNMQYDKILDMPNNSYKNF